MTFDEGIGAILADLLLDRGGRAVFEQSHLEEIAAKYSVHLLFAPDLESRELRMKVWVSERKAPETADTSSTAL